MNQFLFVGFSMVTDCETRTRALDLKVSACTLSAGWATHDPVKVRANGGCPWCRSKKKEHGIVLSSDERTHQKFFFSISFVSEVKQIDTATNVNGSALATHDPDR